jgi:hypothetical protein
VPAVDNLSNHNLIKIKIVYLLADLFVFSTTLMIIFSVITTRRLMFMKNFACTRQNFDFLSSHVQVSCHLHFTRENSQLRKQVR